MKVNALCTLNYLLLYVEFDGISFNFSAGSVWTFNLNGFPIEHVRSLELIIHLLQEPEPG